MEPKIYGVGFILLQRTNENSRAEFSSGLRDAKRAAARNSPQVASSKPPAPRVQHKLRRVARCRADSGPALPRQIGQNGQAGRTARGGAGVAVTLRRRILDANGWGRGQSSALTRA